MKVELDLSYYVTKADLKGKIDTDIFSMALKTDLPSLKNKVDNLNVDKRKTD